MNVIRIAVSVIVAIGLMACDGGDGSGGGGGTGNDINSQNVERVASNALILARLVDEGIKNGVTTDHTSASGCPSGSKNRIDNRPSSGTMEIIYNDCDFGALVWDGVVRQPMDDSANPYKATFLDLQMVKEGNIFLDLHPYLDIGESVLLWGDIEADVHKDSSKFKGKRLEIGFMRHLSNSYVTIENYKLNIEYPDIDSTEYVLEGSIDCDIIPFVRYETRSRLKRTDDHYPHAGVILIVADDGSGVLIDIQSDMFVSLDYFDIFGLTVDIIDTTWQKLASYEDIALLGLFNHYWLSFN